MWSLPDINRMNEIAKAESELSKDLSPEEILKDNDCEYCEEKATIFYEYYDIFSEDPKGFVFLCEEHDSYYGSPAEGYFHCSNCERYHVKNYTWEVYSHIENGETICLKCYFLQEIENPENWITGIEGNNFIFKNDDIIPIDKAILKAKHLIAVSSEYYKEHLEFIDNAEFDSMDGHQISGYNVKNIVTDILKDHNKCMLILDAGYQFAVSIGFYVEKKKTKKQIVKEIILDMMKGKNE